jgi:hypothetical protein
VVGWAGGERLRRLCRCMLHSGESRQSQVDQRWLAMHDGDKSPLPLPGGEGCRMLTEPGTCMQYSAGTIIHGIWGGGGCYKWILSPHHSIFHAP